MQIDFTPSQRTSLGVEWELELVDLDTRQLTSGSDEILTAISPNGDGEHPKAKHELLQSCVEVITGICQTVAEARADLAGTVTEVTKAAAERNIGVMCSGTHPITDWATQRITDNARYAVLVERNQWMARQLQIFGIHVHCGIRAPQKAIPIVNALLAYVPHFLALSASSPYWIGSDTGLASYRSKVFEALPTAGLPYQLSGWDAFETYMDALISSRAIESIREVWWDIRPHPGFGTVGLDAEIVVDNSGRTQPVTVAITDLIEDLLPIARRLDCSDELEAIPRWIDRGASYQRQRAAAAANNGDLAAVVDLLLDEMRDGLPL